MKPIILSVALLIVTLCFNLTLACGEARTTYNVRDHGALGDGQTLDTKAIQKTIDACAENGGGTVSFPAGRFLSGTIWLKDHVTLELETGAVLLGSTRIEDYPLTQCAFPSYTDCYCARALIWAEGLEDIGIVGGGTIDGQGAAFKGNRPPENEVEEMTRGWQDPGRYHLFDVYINRPYVIRMISCSDIRIEGVTLRDSPMWMQHYLNCDFLRVRGISVYNHCGANNDMIDIDCCREVLVSDCFGDTDDDALTLKSTADRPTENVTITNCLLSSHCNAIKLGTESNSGFKNITITNCVIRPSRDQESMAGRNKGLGGISLEIVDGGTMDGITISNIAIHGQTTPIFLRLGDRARPFRRDLPKPTVGALRNIILSDIVATDAAAQGCSITGLPGHPIENVTLSNIKIEFAGGEPQNLVAEVPENPEKYPECTMFGTLPAYGFYCRHVDGLTFRDIDLRYSQPDHRPAFTFDDVSNLVLDDIAAQIEKDAPAQVVLENTSDAIIRGCRPPTEPVFMRLQKGCTRITAIGNDFSSVKTPFAFDDPGLKEILHATANSE